MNIFYDYEGFYGETEAAFLCRQGNELLKLAQSIRQQLGNQGYLLDHYLSMVLEGLNADTMYDIANHCSAVRGQLMGIISDILNGTDKCRAHALYPKVKDYISAHPLTYQEKHTRNCLYKIALSDDFLEYGASQFAEYLQKKHLNADYDSVALDKTFRKISDILGSESQMEQFNLLLRQRFQVVSPMSAFVQCLNESLLYTLLDRDAESSKQIFQLLETNNNK